MTLDISASDDWPAQQVVIGGYKFANLVVLKSMDACRRSVVADFLSRPDSYDEGCVDAMRIPDFVT